jgi:hypothetical protein
MAIRSLITIEWSRSRFSADCTTSIVSSRWPHEPTGGRRESLRTTPVSIRFWTGTSGDDELCAFARRAIGLAGPAGRRESPRTCPCYSARRNTKSGQKNDAFKSIEEQRALGAFCASVPGGQPLEERHKCQAQDLIGSGKARSLHGRSSHEAPRSCEHARSDAAEPSAPQEVLAHTYAVGLTHRDASWSEPVRRGSLHRRLL